jgi:hypothetical protein
MSLVVAKPTSGKLAVNKPTGAGWLITPRFANTWTPAQITTALWLDAADSATITASSGAVSQWNDKSGGATNFTQGTAGARPATGSATLNGRNVLTFDGGDTLLAGDALDNVWTGAAFHLFCVAKNDNVTSTNGAILTKNAGGADNQRSFSYYIRASVLQLVAQYDLFGNEYTRVDGSTSISNSAWTIGAAAYTSTGTGTANTTSRVQMTVNGADETEVVALFSGNLGTIQNGTAQLAVGSNAGTSGTLNSAPLTGAIGEIIVTASVLSTLDRQKTEGYLAHKWGLTANLPADHPYKTNPPAP